MPHKILTWCVTALLILACALPVSAEEFDPQKTGCISVTLTEQHEKEPIAGAQLRIYYVATVHRDAQGILRYAYTEAFADAEFGLEDPSLASQLEDFVARHPVASIQVTTDENGTATCEGLALGLYFVKQAGAVEGFAPCAPFLVTVPMAQADGYVYAVDATPKTEVARLTTLTIQKVWNTDSATEAADQVTIELLRNGKVIQTATLSAQNDWQVTYTGMPESDAYSIREINIPKGFTATYSQAGYVFTVTNTSTLIQTGQVMWPIPVLAVSGMLFIAVGIMLLKNKRKTNA